MTAAALQPVPTKSWYALAVMMGVYTLNAVDRNVISVVLEPIKHEFGLSDGQAGLLGSVTHGVAYALMSIPLGMLADRTNRVRLITLLSTLWSGCTILCGYAMNATQLALARIGVGAAEGGFSPSAMSLIGDFFPPHRRATAVGIFYLSTALGTCLIFLLGGLIAATYGWRAVFLVAGIPGIPLALLLLFTVREPKRGHFDPGVTEHKRSTLRELMVELRRNPATLFAAMGITFGVVVVTAVWVWATSFYLRNHDMGLARAGLFLAIATGPAQAIGSALAGPVADRIGAKHPRWVGVVPAFGLVASVPAAMLMLLSADVTLSLCGLMLFGFLVGVWLPQSFATALILSNPAMRGATIGTVYLLVNLVGTGLGPAFTGWVSDVLGGDAQALRWGMIVTTFLCLPAALFMIAAGRMRRTFAH